MDGFFKKLRKINVGIVEKFVKFKIFFGGIREFERKWNLGNLRIF